MKHAVRWSDVEATGSAGGLSAVSPFSWCRNADPEADARWVTPLWLEPEESHLFASGLFGE